MVSPIRSMKNTRPDQGSGDAKASSPMAVIESRRSMNSASISSPCEGTPPVDGADADPRMTGDLVQADLEPALVEPLSGRRQDALPVPLGVPPQWPRPSRPGRVLRHLKPPEKKWRQL